jgi:YD repeat-containing protein
MPTTMDMFETSYLEAQAPRQSVSAMTTRAADDGCWAVSEVFWEIVVDDRLGAHVTKGLSYDGLGRLSEAASYDGTRGGYLVNDVLRTYDGLGRITGDYLALGEYAAPESSPGVQYAYDDAAHGGRLASITCPDGTVIGYDYGDTGSLNDVIGRLTSILQNNATLESYTYLGLGTVVERAEGNAVKLTYVQQTSGNLAANDGGDIYRGLDRFGRIVDQR